MRTPNLLALPEFDSVALESRRLAPYRVAVAVLVVPLVTVTHGPATSLTWGGAQLAFEGLIWLSTGRLARLGAGTALQRLAFISATVCGCCTWLALSLVFWHTRTDGSQFITLLIWASLLVNAISFGFRAATVFVLLATPVALVMTLAPILSPRFSGPQQLIVSFGVLIFAGYALISGRRNVVAARQLATAGQSLERARRSAEAANLAKSAFLATMSHEIRTPLNGVIGMAQAMARDELPDHQRDRLAVIRQSGETLLMLLNDLLDLSRIESGRMELEMGVVDASEIATSAQSAFTALAADKDIYLAVEVAPEARGSWRGDPTRVRQIVYNLVSNAVKFTENGSVQIRVSHDGRALRISVADTGPGVPPERLGALFEKFVQADASTTRRFGGSGLGLAICRELAELMGGEISATSLEGQGSTFTVTLPLARAENVTRPAEAAAPRDAADPAGLRILAAEDNPMNQLVLKTLLSPLGVELMVVDDGQAAVEAFAAGGWDVVLMDVQMPVMDGPTAAGRIRSLEAEAGAARTPILALTANAMAHHALQYERAGMDGLVAKPIQLEQLLAAIEAALAQRQGANAV